MAGNGDESVETPVRHRQKERDKPLKQRAEEFCSETTMHGIQYVGKPGMHSCRRYIQWYDMI